MKTAFSLLLASILFLSNAYAINITRETMGSNGAGTSTIYVCNPTFCTTSSVVNMGSTYSNSLARVNSIVITFDYAFHWGSITTFYIDPVAVMLAGGAYVTYTDSYGCEQLQIRHLGGENFSYRVYALCL